MRVPSSMPRPHFSPSIFRDRETAVLCGAGVSKNSGLPLANELKDYILNKLCANEDDINAIRGASLPFEAFMETIADHSDISLILDIFQRGEPNATHLFLARLAKNGEINMIGTTNFDLLLERALVGEGLREGKDFRVYRREDDFAKVVHEGRIAGPISIIKIHGCASDTTTIRTTMRAVASRALSRARKHAIDLLCSRGSHRTLMVLGYSSSDEFDLNPAIRSVVRKRKQVILVEHRRRRGRDIRTLREAPERNPFRRFPGLILECNTDALIRESWNAFGVTHGRYRPLRASVPWEENVERWARCVRTSTKHLIVGKLRFQLSHFSPTVEHCKMALRSARRDSAPRTMAECLALRGQAGAGLGEYRKAAADWAQALTIARNLKDARLRVSCLEKLGGASHNLGDFGKALDYYREALQIARLFRYKSFEVLCNTGLGNAFYRLEHFGNARRHYQRALRLSQESGYKSAEAANLLNLGNTCKELRSYTDARRAYFNGLQVARQIGYSSGEATALVALADLNFATKRFASAFQFYQEALEIATRLNYVVRIINCKQGLGNLSLAQNDLSQALLHLRHARFVARRIGKKSEEAEAWTALARVYRKLGCHKTAIRNYRIAETILTQTRQHRARAEVRDELALTKKSQAMPR